MGWTYSTHGNNEKCIQSFGHHSEDLGIDGMILLEWMLGKMGGKLWDRCVWLMIGTSSCFL
jgi:hypothetical protein